MGAIFEMSLQSETLNADELQDISGAARKSDQVEWFKRNGWVFYLNRAGLPVVGRLYARMKLAGINPATLAVIDGGNPSGWQLDLGKVR